MEKLTKKQKIELKKEMEKVKEIATARQNFVRKIFIYGGVFAVVVLSIFGLVSLSNNSSNTSVLSASQASFAKINNNDLVFGPKEAKVTLIEYSDFECPACATEHLYVKKLLSEYNGKILFVYRFFPLTQIHKYSMLSAQAALSAHKQGKFFEMQDKLFDNQSQWSESENAPKLIDSYAQEIGLDMNKYNQDLNSNEVKGFIQNQQNSGINSGINHTPTFFINGREVLQNPGSYEDFKQLIDNELK